METSKPLIPTDLTKAAANGDLILFVGSGLSKKFGFPNWKELTIKILEELSKTQPNLKSLIDPTREELFTPIEVLSKIKNHQTEILRILNMTFKLPANPDLTLHKRLFDVSGKIITTNYDKALETANPLAEFIPYQSDYKISQLNKFENFVFKIHGCVDIIDQCIVFPDQYDSLYRSSPQSSPIFELQKIISEKTILFLGFGMNDPYVLELFHFIKNIYNGFSPKHFVLTTEPKLKSSGFEPLHIESYDHIENVIAELARIKRTKASIPSVLPTHSNGKNDTNCSILIAKPIDKIIEFNFDEILESIKNYDITCHLNFLNEENLREADGYDYLFVFTHLMKNQLIIEDEYLKSKPIPISSIDQYYSGRLKAIFVFYMGDVSIKEIQVSCPLVLIDLTNKKVKEVVGSIGYKILKKNDISSIRSNVLILNHDLLNLNQVQKGDVKIIKFEPSISKLIDKKNLLKFIGRKTDLEQLIRKLIDLKIQNMILTIKGSGGIGKTTIVTKAAIELAERGTFEKGVDFIPCHSIQSFENFEFYLSQSFDLPSSLNLKEQIKENFKRKDKLIILDNFETLLQLSEKGKIVDLVSYACDYSVIVVTSRQLLDLEYEEIFELRNFTTDEGVELFKSIYPNIDPKLESMLRYDIIENILNNNPLAIKLIAKGLPNSKDIAALKEDLEQNIFKNEEIQQIFERPEDINIEKSKSIYHSINYSFQSLTEPEKLAFELLSIFPDGIPMENFKKFSKSSKHKISIDDKEIKSLDNKSLLENSNKFLKLQSIISRFSDAQFKKRSPDVKNDYYSIGFHYNETLIRVLLDRKAFRFSSALKFLDLHLNNFLKCIEYLPKCQVEISKKLEFIDDIALVFQQTNQPKGFLKKISEYVDQESNLTDRARQLLKLIELRTVYWTSNFDSFDAISKTWPLTQIDKLDITDKIDDLIYGNLKSIYVCEGFSVQILEDSINRNDLRYSNLDSLFELGCFEEAKLLSEAKDNPDFFDFEIQFCLGLLDKKRFGEYYKSLFKKENLEIVQMTYLKLKAFGDVTIDDIKQLVVSNPYTDGIINLMRALTTNDKTEKRYFFEKAIDKTSHIKYYHTECILQYANFLVKEDDPSASYWIKFGKTTAEKYYFRYLMHEFVNLESGRKDIYDQSLQKNPIDKLRLENFVHALMRKRK